MASLSSFSPSSVTTKRADLRSGWTVLPHGELQPLAENLWWTWGSASRGRLSRGSLRRAMVVARRSDDRLVIHDPIALGEAQMDALATLGKPAYIIVPAAPPHRDASAWKDRFPKAQVIAPRGVLAAVRKVLEVDGIYEDVPVDGAVRFEMLRGVGDAIGAMLVRSADGISIVLNGGRVREDRRRPFGLVSSIFGPRTRLGRLAKLFLVRNKRALREDLERWAEEPDLVRLIVTHERIARGPAATQTLRDAAANL